MTLKINDFLAFSHGLDSLLQAAQLLIDSGTPKDSPIFESMCTELLNRHVEAPTPPKSTKEDLQSVGFIIWNEELGIASIDMPYKYSTESSAWTEIGNFRRKRTYIGSKVYSVKEIFA